MTILLCLISAVTVWWFMWLWAKRQLSLTVEELDTEIRFWRRQAEVADANLARAVRDVTVREEAWRQGRDAMLALMRLLRTSWPDSDPPSGPEPED